MPDGTKNKLFFNFLVKLRTNKGTSFGCLRSIRNDLPQKRTPMEFKKRVTIFFYGISFPWEKIRLFYPVIY